MWIQHNSVFIPPEQISNAWRKANSVTGCTWRSTGSPAKSPINKSTWSTNDACCSWTQSCRARYRPVFFFFASRFGAVGLGRLVSLIGSPFLAIKTRYRQGACGRDECVRRRLAFSLGYGAHRRTPAQTSAEHTAAPGDVILVPHTRIS